MIKSGVEKLADEIGFELGTSDDQVQANLLNAFCRGLNNSIPDKHALDMQVCYIVDKLNEKTEKILILLVDFIKIKNDK